MGLSSQLDDDLRRFRQSLTATEPPAGLTLALTGLWRDGKGDWTRAHESAQQDEGPEGSWVHAYQCIPSSEGGRLGQPNDHPEPNTLPFIFPPK
jgi:hypothetical protein